jgi:hypothetical protein
MQEGAIRGEYLRVRDVGEPHNGVSAGRFRLWPDYASPTGPADCYAKAGHGRFSTKDGDMAEKSNKHEANAQFAKTQRANDAKKATSEYESAAAALRVKTERLKALRLARDAAAPQVAPAAPKRKAKKKSDASLSDWLDGEAKEGRRG